MPDSFDLNSYLKDNGLELTGMDHNTGMPMVADKTGNARPFDVNALIKDLGEDPSQIKEIKYNSPSTAIQESPVSLADRAKLSLGNPEGNLKYLSNKFEEAAYHPDHGFSVKDNGIWKAVDPNLLGKGDAWDKTKALVKHGFGLINNPDLAGDIVELGPEALNAVTTSIGGAIGAGIGTAASLATFGAASPTVGPLTAAGIAAGAAASGSIRTLLGRAVGTYEATPEQTVQDIGMETLMSLGGHAVGVGVKPGLDMFIKGASKVGQMASEGTKDAVAAVVGNMTKAGQAATRTLIDNAPEVGSQISSAARAAGGNISKAIDHVATLKTQAVEGMLNAASKALPERYGQLLNDLVEHAGEKNFTVDVKQVVNNAFDTLEQAGLGQKVTAITKAEALANGDTPLEYALGFKFLTPEQFSNQLATGAENARNLTPDMQRSLDPLLKSLSQYSKIGQLSGKAAAKALKNLEQNINEIGKSAFDGDNQVLKSLTSEISSAFRNSVSDQFESKGLAPEYGALSQLYGQYGDAVNLARRIANSDKGIETLTNQLNAPAGKGITTKGLRDSLVGLLGQSGDDMMQHISVLDSAQKFLPRTPSLGIFPLAAASGAASAKAGSGVGALVAAGGALGSSPRFMARTIQMGMAPIDQSITYGLKATDFLKSLPPKQLRELVGNDQMMQNFMRIISQGAMNEKQWASGLLQSAPQGPQSINEYAKSVMNTVKETGSLPEDLNSAIEGMGSSIGSLESLGTLRSMTSKLVGKKQLQDEATTLWKTAKEAYKDSIKAEKTGASQEVQMAADKAFSEARQALNRFKDFLSGSPREAAARNLNAARGSLNNPRNISSIEKEISKIRENRPEGWAKSLDNLYKELQRANELSK